MRVASTALAGALLVGGGVAAQLLFRAHARESERTEDERERAVAFLARNGSTAPACGAPLTAPCQRSGVEDIDGDGARDCWRSELGPSAYGPGTKLTLVMWAGCAGDAITMAVEQSGIAILAIPERIASPGWLAWIARQFANDAVDPAFAPSPQWQWVLANADRQSWHASVYGLHAPVYFDASFAPWRASAVIVPHVPGDWMTPVYVSEEVRQSPLPSGARILVDYGHEETAAPITCAGLEISTTPGGIIARRPRDHAWTWLFRGLAERGGYGALRLYCENDLVLASDARDGNSFASVVTIDPISGGWVYEPGNDCCPGAELTRTSTGAILIRDTGVSYPLTYVKPWLASPLATRISPFDLGLLARPELGDPITADVQMRVMGWREHRVGELSLDTVPSVDITPDLRLGLARAGTCGGWSVSASPTAILVERAGRARWLYVESTMWPRRIASTKCVRGLLVVDEESSVDVLAAPSTDPTIPAPGSPVHRTVRFDIARGRIFNPVEP